LIGGWVGFVSLCQARHARQVERWARRLKATGLRELWSASRETASEMREWAVVHCLRLRKRRLVTSEVSEQGDSEETANSNAYADVLICQWRLVPLSTKKLV
jgi:hypothetical protein